MTRRGFIALSCALAAAAGATGLAAWRLVPRPRPPVAVEIVTTDPGLSATEVERAITVPIEDMVQATPNLVRIESVTTMGLSRVRLEFPADAEPFSAFTDVQERLRTANLPSDVGLPTVQIAGSGGTLTYALVPEPSTDLATLRTTQDWNVERALETIPGVGMVEACGGRERRIFVNLDPARLAAYGVTADDVVSAVGKPGLMRAFGGFARLEEIGPAVVATRNGAPVRIHDVASVESGAVRPDCVARRGDAEIVVGEIALQRGARVAEVAPKVAARLRELEGPFKVELLEVEARAPVIHARVAGPRDDVLAAVKGAPGVTDVVTREREEELDLVVRVASARAVEDAARAIAARLHPIGARYDLTSPAGLPRELRVARVRIFGEDPESRRDTAEKAVKVLAAMSELHGVAAPDLARGQEVRIEPDRAALARFGVGAADVACALRLTLDGEVAGRVQEGERAFDVVVRLPHVTPDLLPRVPLTARDGAKVPLEQVARVVVDDRPKRITREQRQRYLDVLFDAPSDRAFEAAKKELAAKLPLPTGMHLTWARAGN